MDPEHRAAIERLFSYYIAEDFYEEQWGTAGDLTADFLEYASKGFNHVRDKVEKSLDFDLTFDNATSPVNDEDVAARMLLKLNGHEHAAELVKAAQLVWRHYLEPRGEEAYRITVGSSMSYEVMSLICLEFKGRVINRSIEPDALIATYVLEFCDELHASAYLYNYRDMVKEKK